MFEIRDNDCKNVSLERKSREKAPSNQLSLGWKQYIINLLFTRFFMAILVALVYIQVH